MYNGIKQSSQQYKNITFNITKWVFSEKQYQVKIAKNDSQK